MKRSEIDSKINNIEERLTNLEQHLSVINDIVLNIHTDADDFQDPYKITERQIFKPKYTGVRNDDQSDTGSSLGSDLFVTANPSPNTNPDKTQQLIEAVEKGDFKLTKELIESGVDPNIEGDYSLLAIARISAIGHHDNKPLIKQYASIINYLLKLPNLNDDTKETFQLFEKEYKNGHQMGGKTKSSRKSRRLSHH